MAISFNISWAKAVTLPFALAAITTFSACTTMSPESRSAYDQTQKTLASQPVAIISDGCIVRVEMGKDDIMYQQSDMTSLAMAQTVKTRLINKGIQVSNTSSPFICGTLTKEKLAKVDILLTDKAKDQLNTAYPILGSTNNFDAATNQAYLNLYTALGDKKAAAVKAKATYTPLGLDTNSVNTIRKTEGANKVFVAMVTGSKPSLGASLVMGTATAVATGGAYVSALQKGQNYAIYLVNLETNQIEWTKSGVVAGNVFKMPVSTSLDTKKMLDPLYSE